MPDYSAWPERRLGIASLMLDTVNPRIPENRSKAWSQRDLIEELVKHDDVLDLARDIAKNGFDPVESLLGTEDDDQTVVLEGNRRLAALKLLDNPTLAPHDAQRAFKALATQQGTRTTKVRVLMAPSRDAAAPIILRKHTGLQVERWSVLQQARFYRRLADGGLSVEELAKKYGVTVAAVRSFLRMDAMYELAQSLDLPEDTREKIQDARKFPASVLQRLLEMVAFKEFLGIDFDPNGRRVTATAAPKNFRKAYGRVLTDIVDGHVDTRTLNTVKSAEQYIENNWRSVEPKKEKRTYSMDDLLGAPARSATPAVPAAQPSSAKRAEPNTVIPRSLKCTLNHPRAREIFVELKALKLPKFNNAHAVLVRVLLELGVTHYVTKMGIMKTMCERARHKEKKPVDWVPSLRQMLKELANNPDAHLNAPTRKAVNRLLDTKGSIVSVETLDGFVHSGFEWPDEREIRRMWRALEEVLAVVLAEPTQPAASGAPAHS